MPWQNIQPECSYSLQVAVAVTVMKKKKVYLQKVIMIIVFLYSFVYSGFILPCFLRGFYIMIRATFLFYGCFYNTMHFFVCVPDR